MKLRLLRALTLGLAFLATLAVPQPAAAVTQVSPTAPTPPPNKRVTYTYKTFLEPTRITPGPLGDLNENFGTLTLTFNPDGTIQGTYRSDYGDFTTVSGGRTGASNLWLLIGNLHFTGRFTRHGIVASSDLTPSGAAYRLHAQYQHS